MALIFPADQNFDCGSCTRCCRGWNVHVDARSYAQVAGSPLAELLRDLHGGQEPMVHTEVDGEKACLTRMSGGACVFLDGKLCTIHRDIAATAKPLGCREFPFAMVETPDGTYVGLSYYCSAVQANSGRPIEAHGGELEQLLTEREQTRVGFDPIVFDHRAGITWNAYKYVENHFSRALADPQPPLALWRAMVALFMAVLDLRRQVAEMNVDPETWVLLRDEKVAAALNSAAVAAATFERDELFEYLDNMFLTGVIGVIESGSNEVRQTNMQALQHSGVVHSDTFKQIVDLAFFDDFRTRFDARWSWAEMRRLLSMMLFRKFLAQRRPLVENAGVLYLTLPLLEWMRDYSAYVGSKLEPDISDVRCAFDVIEKGFTLHSRGMDVFFSELTRTYLLQLEHLNPA